ncbi:hypothetical protein ACPCAJ_21105 [Streptomyces griseoincarnatus]
MHQPPPQRNQRTDRAARKILKFGCLPAFVLLGVIIALGNAVDDDSASGGKPAANENSPTASPTAPAKASPGLDNRQITELTVDMVWDSYSETRRDLFCLSLDVEGPDAYADQLKSDNIDPDYAAELMTEKCESR